MSRTLDLLAVNPLADALYAPFEPADNLARMTFLDPAGRSFYTDWDRAAQATVANLREASGFDPDNPRLRELVRTLTERSPDFTRLWNAHTVRGKTRDAKHLLHPDVGPSASPTRLSTYATPPASSSSSTTPNRAVPVPSPSICSVPSTRPAAAPTLARATGPTADQQAGHHAAGRRGASARRGALCSPDRQRTPALGCVPVAGRVR